MQSLFSSALHPLLSLVNTNRPVVRTVARSTKGYVSALPRVTEDRNFGLADLIPQLLIILRPDRHRDGVWDGTWWSIGGLGRASESWMPRHTVVSW